MTSTGNVKITMASQWCVRVCNQENPSHHYSPTDQRSEPPPKSTAQKHNLEGGEVPVDTPSGIRTEWVEPASSNWKRRKESLVIHKNTPTSAIQSILWNTRTTKTTRSVVLGTMWGWSPTILSWMWLRMVPLPYTILCPILVCGCELWKFLWLKEVGICSSSCVFKVHSRPSHQIKDDCVSLMPVKCVSVYAPLSIIITQSTQLHSYEDLLVYVLYN